MRAVGGAEVGEEAFRGKEAKECRREPKGSHSDGNEEEPESEVVFGKGGGEGADARGENCRGAETGCGGGKTWVEEKGGDKPSRACRCADKEDAQGCGPTELAFKRVARQPQAKEVEEEMQPGTVQQRIRKGSPALAQLKWGDLEGQGGC